MGRCARTLAISIVVSLLLAGVIPRAVEAAPLTAAGAQNATLVLDWVVNSDHGGIFTAIQRGYLARKHVNLTVQVPSSSTAQIPLVAAGRADFAISYETDLLAARAAHIPVRSVMCIMQHPLDTVMALKSSGITRPRDLQGHTVGMAGAPSDRPLVTAMVEHDGGSIDKVHMVNVGYNLLPALLSKRVDAVIGVYWTWEAIQAREKGFPVNVMRVEQWGAPNYCELVLIASESTIRQRPELVRDTVQALQEGYADAEAHPQIAWEALHHRDRTLQKTLVLQSLQLLRSAVTDAPTIGEQNGAQWRNYARWLAINKLISHPVDANAAYTNEFVAPGIR